jgi:hypothetical protein
MPSHLTRYVFRRLLSNKPIIFRCPHQIEQHVQRRNGALSAIRPPSKRTLFGFSIKPPRQIRDTDVQPGVKKMMDLFLMDKIRARPPPAPELVKAFKAFFTYKLKTKEAVNDILAQHALRTFRHLRDTNTNEADFGLSLSDLITTRDVMMKMPDDKLNTHNEFARELFTEISRRKLGEKAGGGASTLGDLNAFIIVLTLTSNSLEARKLVEEFYNTGSDIEKTANRESTGAKLFNHVLKGFAKEKNEVELVKTAQIAESYGVSYSPTFHETMTKFYALKNDLQGTKQWYSKKIHQSRKPNAATVLEVLRFCMRNDEMDWCNAVFRGLLEDNPKDKQTWDIIFQWAAGALGKGVEEVEHMMQVMVRRNPQDESIRPDVETINGLVDLAISKNDPYLAERYLSLGLKSGIRPNAKTFILQMNYRINALDFSGAQAAYDALQAEELVDQEDLPVINQYIRALCSAPSPNYDRITSIVADLDERKVRLEADTVSALCLMYLKRGELHETIDILQAHNFHYTLDERARIRDTFMGYILDRHNTPEAAWDAYTILRQMFDEIDINIRTQMMNEFFSRNRSDMGFHAFGHMRQHIRQEKRPNLETYVQCFEGIARCADAESLDMVYNMMKMDSSIEPSTRLYNALMLAYAACEDPYRALEFWDDITNSVEGPTYSSLQIVFRACERKPFGYKPAKEIWNKMRRMEIEVTPEVFTAYVGALAGQALIDEAKALIEGMEAEFGYGPDIMT